MDEFIRKPCPFCGGTIIRSSVAVIGTMRVVFLYCSTCQSSGPKTVVSKDNLAQANIKAEKDWNTRHEPIS